MNSMKRTIVFLFAIMVSLLAFNAWAEECQGTIKGRIVNENGESVEGAYIYALEITTHEKIIGTSFSDENGIFEMTIGCGDDLYLIISCLGYNQSTNKFSLTQNQMKDFGNCELETNAHELQTVVVKGRHLRVRSQPDGFSVDVRQLAESSNNAFDLLGRLPQINVKGNDIKVVGKEKILVRVNNVLQRVDAADLANVLRGYDASLIDRVEVITSPSVKYDPEGTAAMIILHMSSKFNRYASGNAGMEFMKGSGYEGRYAVYGSGVFNNNKLFVDITPSYNHNYSRSEENATYIYDDNTTYRNHVPSKGKSNYAGGYATVQYQYNNKGFIGLNANINKKTTDNSFYSREIMLGQTTLNHNDIEIDRPRFNIAAYAEHAFSNGFKGWLEGTFYNYRENTDLSFVGTDELGLNPFMTYMSDQRLKVYGANLSNDYSIAVSHDGRHNIDFGIKAYFTKISNGRDVEMETDTDIMPSEQKDIVKINETKINPYISYKWRPSDALSFRAGVQLSYTDRAISNLDIDDRHIEYTSFLPDFLTSWTPVNNSRFTFIITSGNIEPKFDLINPFEWRVSQYKYIKGNLSLKSERRYNYKLVYTYKGNFSVTCYVNQKKNVISSVDNIIDDQVYVTYENAQNCVDYGISPSYYFDRLKWLEFSVDAYCAYGISKGIIPEVARRETSYKWGGNIYAGFVFNKQRTFTGYMSFDYTGRQRNVITTIEPTYNFATGLSLYLLDRKMCLSLSGLNIFSSTYKGKSHASGYTMKFNNRYDYPTIYFSLTYKFNNLKDSTPSRQKTIRNIEQRM